ncbi:hypothetical protein MNBD_BACTEROID07-1143 [hydrothermal vent metagenome]|uniref:Ig-like domain-containing protein n=1 Tax=hydrothermal vent metagenome TaxID=652676 RepID=A0A3B0VCW6_9ZZZZ
MRQLLILVFSLIFNLSFAQQISIPRVSKMPDIPQPFEMRNWKQVATQYDKLVFNMNVSGQYLPLATVFNNTTNYPNHPGLAIQSYVGTNSLPGKEAINVIPAVVGATLVGIDKSDQYGYNWPLLCEEYFNRRPAEDVYLNSPVASSGHDWWYETMPNVFFYQLNYFYPHTGDFDHQVTTLADRWLEAVKAMGGSTTPWHKPYMNYRAFNLATMTPLETGVKEPEAAGAIGWILYQAFEITGDNKYRIGAELSLDFLSSWGENPSYEIQLPYGVYIAARMNAEQGTEYNIEKMINWCFDRGNLRGWGVITGNWGGKDIDGLIGEVNTSAPDYVFNMNSLEQVGALVPAVRYDDRFATSIAKWVLNVANASRFYYSEFLPDNMQDNKAWTTKYDTNSVIAYEALREKNTGPYGTGDAVKGGWAHTNLGLYGSSHVGILGAIIKKTNVEGILQLDLLATDYYHNAAFPTYLYYNPYATNRKVELNLNKSAFDIYDAVSNQVILKNVTGIVQIDVPAKSSVMAVVIPANSKIVYHLNHASVNSVIIDYNTGQKVLNYPPRIIALTAKDSVVAATKTVTFYCTAKDRETTQLKYDWNVDGKSYESADSLVWKAPADTGTVKVICKVTDAGGLTNADTLTIRVVKRINYPPVIEKIKADDRMLAPASSTSVTCFASDPNGDKITYAWKASEGQIDGAGKTITYVAPAKVADVYLACTVADGESAVTDSILILVRNPEQGQIGKLVAYYKFNNNADDITGNGHNGLVTNCTYVDDMRNNEKRAIRFNISTSKVVVPNDKSLNFQDGLTVSFWLKINRFFDHESYLVSHGNWITRWKISLTNKHIRFTVNGSNGVIDIDSETKLDINKWYHVVSLYNGKDCLVFIDGKLEGYKPFEGQINKTTYDLVLGQSLPDQTGFNFNGIMDNLRIYNYGISYKKVNEIYNSELLSVVEKQALTNQLIVYPNPANNIIHIHFTDIPNREFLISIYSSSGVLLNTTAANTGSKGLIETPFGIQNLKSGVYWVKVGNKHKEAIKPFIISR